MRPIFIASLIMLTLLGVGAAFRIDAVEKPHRHYPKPTDPPPPSPIYTPSAEHAWSEQEIEQQATEHNARLQAAIEQALLSKNAQRREAVFTFILPELVQVDPARVVAMVAAQGPGEARNTLLSEVTRVWIGMDQDAAVQWMKSLPEGERRACAITAVESIYAQSPGEAAALADQFGITKLVRSRFKASRD